MNLENRSAGPSYTPSWRGTLYLVLTTTALVGCSSDPETDPQLGQVQQAIVGDPLAASCGYSVSDGTYATWPGGYQAWVKLDNVSGQTGTAFEVLVDVGDTTISGGFLAEYEAVEDGYSVTEPSWLKYQKIPQGRSYTFQFNGAGVYQGVTPYIISINGVTCDQVPPQVSLSASSELFTEDGTLTLTAEASDNVAVRRVVFERDGEVIAVDKEAPYTFDIDVTEALNGRHLYTATAIDPTGNQQSSAPVRVLVAIDDKFFGTAPGGPEDYTHLLAHFDQLTPENAGKWGNVEATRDVMNWADLDTAYQFALDNDLRFKLHTLIWGQQQPAWLSSLSPEEQLEEINEWMAELAARYPSLEMIDAVNEPLHSVPAYSEALGGAGETGYDWVINAFEMAREHFPQSQLILNDFQILILENFTQDYLQVINLLDERGLIDGIGVQAHFLERAEISVVAANLDTLAATGLPIYVSELDVDFADDARQANVMRDLFTVFWNHPSVVGVTHWGHLQGSMFQPNAYLVRGDGTSRPALDWLDCFVAGGTDCTVPEYVPPGWQGGEFGLTLEAEEYDVGQGLAALGDFVAFTDDGDWLGYYGVEFQETWDTFWITYAKGNDVGSISVLLGGLEGEEILHVELPNTGGFGTYVTLEVPMTPLSGTHDVTIRFNDAFGVANVDSFRFGTTPPDTEVNLVADGGFEGSSLSGWQSWIGSTLSLSTEQAHSGSQSMLATNRSSTGQFAVYNLTSVVTPGTTYSVSARTYVSGTETTTVRLAAKVECADPPAGHNTFPWLHNNTGVVPGQWNQLSGELVIPDCDIIDVAIFFEGTPTGVEQIFLDDVKVTPPDPNLVTDGSFEDGVGAWHSWIGSSLATSTAQAHSGNQSLLATNRSSTGQFAVYNLTSAVTPGTTYSVSAQTYVSGTETTTVRLAAKVECSDPPAGHNTFPWLHNNTGVVPGQWNQLSGELVIPDCNIIDVAIFFEGTPTSVEQVFLDDVSVLPPDPNLVSDGSFEDGIGGWHSWIGSTLGTSMDQAFTGEQSLLATGRGSTGQFAVLNLTSAVTPGTTYSVSAQTYVSGTETTTVRLAAKVECADPPAGHNTFPWLHNNTGVVPGQWNQISGQLVIPDCTLIDVAIFFEGTPTSVEQVFIDDVSVLPQ